MDLEQLTQTLHHEIPLSQTLGIALQDYRDLTLSVSAPLAPNINHKQTAFGGSLYAVAVLAGWSLVNLRLAEYQEDLPARCEVVIYHSDMQYLRGVNDDFSARVEQSDGLRADRFIQRLLRHGKVSCTETIEIEQGGEVKGCLRAKYVVLLKKK